MNNGPQHGAAVMPAHIFLEGFIVFLYWPLAKRALQSTLSANEFLSKCHRHFQNRVLRYTTHDLGLGLRSKFLIR